LQKFNYNGGCFKEGATYLMKKPEKEVYYHFENVKFEVRNSRDPVIYAG